MTLSLAQTEDFMLIIEIVEKCIISGIWGVLIFPKFYKMSVNARFCGVYAW